MLARGHTLEALRKQGLTLIEGGQTAAYAVRAEDDPARLGVQGHRRDRGQGARLAGAQSGIGPLIGPDTVVVTAMNGVPWWFFARPPCSGLALASVDPDGAIGRAIPARQVLGCVVHLTASTPAPGTVRTVSARA